MNRIDKRVLDSFKKLLIKRGNLQRLILFGSRARGDAGSYSDLDIVVVLDDSAKEEDFDYVSDSAWEAGFRYGIVIVPVDLHKASGKTALNGIPCLHRLLNRKVSLYERTRSFKSYKISP